VGGVITWGTWWAMPCFFVYGVLYGSASDSRWHECGHGTAFRTAWMNQAVYQIACFMIMRNPTAWRWSHTRHHTDTIVVGRDPEIVLMRPPVLWKLALNYLGILDIPDTEFGKAKTVARVWMLIYAGTIVATVITGSILPFMLIGLPRFYGAWHHVLTGVTQHAGMADNVLDHRLNSRSIKLNPVSRFIYWNMNYHVEHHMFPMVPFHKLPELHREIAADLPPITGGLVAAYREILPVLFAQRRNPDRYIHRALPGVA
jgi:fatty acid desaturase